jgi:cytoskeletal protein CcmA (bactofilin family)
MKFAHLTSFSFITLLAISTSSCIIHVGGHDDDEYSHHNGNVSHVMGDIEIDADSQMQDLSAVNGDIILANRVSAEDIDTVNGSIEIGKHVSLFSASSVNGDISAEEDLMVKNDVSTVNGNIEINEDSKVGGNISTVNGDIKLRAVEVQGELETKNGDISLLKGSVVSGDIIYRSQDQNRWSNNDLPKLIIDSDSTVLGRIILQRKVILEIDNPALLSKVERNYSTEK